MADHENLADTYFGNLDSEGEFEGFEEADLVNPIYDVVSARFRNTYTQDENIAIYEGMVPWRGRLRFKKYIPNKPDKFGADFDPDPNATVGEVQLGHSYGMVMGLLPRSNLLNKGYCLYVDNFYSSPTLFDRLSAENTMAVATVRLNRCEVPVALKTKAKGGDVMYRQCDNLLAMKWTDKRHMGGVDRSDQLGKYYSFSRKTKEWWLKLFFHIINLVVTNAYILYLKNRGEGRPLTHYKFRLELAKQMMASHEMVKVPRGRPSIHRDQEKRLTESHFPCLIPAKEGAKVKNPTRKCVLNEIDIED
ncbi:piggyBac transposable element-derived protein 4-like [Dreissena polymorpha]|uniref:piggyBac transposable element-derived protein 4-like n=1 Tax=Dreissena polymorpha TaxID=45954 RepID=UPI002263FFD7|nr:piggyBac transposable element-derived protein 4-like [Dreissena polymorpha]